MKILSVQIENFGPFLAETLELADRGLVLVQGANRVSSSADSNGAGKSYILESIVWGLFGKTIRRDLAGTREKTGDNVVNRKAGKNCSVTVKIDAAGQEITIVRYRKHKTGKNSVTVEIDGHNHTKGTNKETDAFICDLLGLDFETFVRSVYFDGRSIVPFPILPDAEIKAIFERVLSLEDLGKALEVVKKRKAAANGEIARIEREIAFKQAEGAQAKLDALNAVSRRDGWETTRKAEIDNREARISSLLASRQDPAALEAQLAGLDAKKAEIESKLAQFSVLDKMVADIDGRIAALRARDIAIAGELVRLEAMYSSKGGFSAPAGLVKEKADLHAELRIVEQRRQQANADIQNAQAKIGKPCGECGKVYGQGDLGAIIEHAKRHLEETAKQTAEIEAKLAGVDLRYAEAAGAHDADVHNKIQALQIERAGLDDKPLLAEKAKLDKLVLMRAQLTAELQGLPAQRASVVAQIDAAKRLDADVALLQQEIAALRAQANPFIEDVKRFREREEEAVRQVSLLEQDRARHGADVRKLEVLERAYGRSGLKAHILETVTPALNERANAYASKLTDGEVQIDFSTVSKNKDGTYAERFSVGVTNTAGGEAYLDNSSGEKQKINLAIALAMSDLVAARAAKGIDLWVADEIAESLDPTALDRVVDVLKDKASERGTLLAISHSDMTALIPTVMLVEKHAQHSSRIVR